MSDTATEKTWSRGEIAEAIRTIHDAAVESGAEGLDDDDVARVLAWQSYTREEAADLLWLSLDRRHLVEASRMRIDEAGAVTSERRYFTLGARP